MRIIYHYSALLSVKRVIISHMGPTAGPTRWRSFVCLFVYSLQPPANSDHRACCLENTSGTRRRAVLPTLTPAWARPWLGLTALMEINWIYLWSIRGGGSIRDGNDHQKAADHSDWRDMTSLTSHISMAAFEAAHKSHRVWYDLRNNWHLQACGLSAHGCFAFAYGPFKQ